MRTKNETKKIAANEPLAKIQLRCTRNESRSALISFVFQNLKIEESASLVSCSQSQRSIEFLYAKSSKAVEEKLSSIKAIKKQ